MPIFIFYFLIFKKFILCAWVILSAWMSATCVLISKPQEGSENWNLELQWLWANIQCWEPRSTHSQAALGLSHWAISLEPFWRLDLGGRQNLVWNSVTYSGYPWMWFSLFRLYSVRIIGCAPLYLAIAFVSIEQDDISKVRDLKSNFAIPTFSCSILCLRTENQKG